MVWWLVWQSSTWHGHYLRVKPCDISTTKPKSWEMRQTCITNCASMQSMHTSSPRILFRCRNATCKRSVSAVRQPLVSTLHIGINKMTILLCFPCMVEWRKRSGMAKSSNWSTSNFWIAWRVISNEWMTLTSTTWTWCSFVRSLNISNSPANWRRKWRNLRNWKH